MKEQKKKKKVDKGERNTAHLEHLVEVLTEVLDKVHVGDAGQHQLSGLLGEHHLGLGQPRPVEGVWGGGTEEQYVHENDREREMLTGSSSLPSSL